MRRRVMIMAVVAIGALALVGTRIANAAGPRNGEIPMWTVAAEQPPAADPKQKLNLVKPVPPPVTTEPAAESSVDAAVPAPVAPSCGCESTCGAAVSCCQRICCPKPPRCLPWFLTWPCHRPASCGCEPTCGIAQPTCGCH